LSKRITVLIVVGLFFVSQFGYASRSPPGSVTEHWFDQNGEEIKTALNGRVTYDKNAAANPDDPVYEYDSNDNITKITYPDGTYVTREYNGPNGEMSKKINEAGVITTYTYDTRGNLTSKVEAEGAPCARETRYVYDANGDMLSSTIMNPSGTNHETHFTYDSFGHVLSETDAMGGVTSNAYDQYGNLVSVTDPAGRTRSMTYDLAGRGITETDFTGNMTSNTYDIAGNLIHREVHDVSSFCILNSTFTFDSENRLISESNVWGQVTSNTYDSDGNLIRQEIRGRGELLSVISYTYNLDGKQTSKSIEMNGETRAEIYGYYEVARLVSIEDTTGTTAIEYDGDSERIKTVVSPLVTRAYTYDARGRPTEVKETAGDATRSTLYAYNSLGGITGTVDPLGRKTQYGYDELSQRIMAINARGGTNRFDYNFMGLISDLIDANGNETTFEYDLLGQLTKKTYADSTSVRYSYNALRQLIEKADARGQKTTYAYDQQGRMVTNKFYNSGQTLVKSVAYGYDPYGRMTSWNDGRYSGAVIYDDINRIRTVSVDYGPFSKMIAYRYNAWGQKESCQYPDGTVYQYAYDAQGRLARMEIPGEGAVSFGMDKFGRLASVTLPGGSCKIFAYNAWQALTTNVVIDSAQNQLLFRAYSRNLAGNILGQQTEYGNYEYQYDAIDQLTNSLAPHCSEGFAYDAMGNRTVSAQGTNMTSYSANALNQYFQIENRQSAIENYEYDQNGNQLVHYRELSDGSIITNHLAWDIENRLTAITNHAGEVARYTYDSFGRRLSKVVNGTTNYYLYADEGLVGEYDADGNEICSYGYQPDSQWMNNPVWMRTEIPALNDGGTNYLYHLNDHLGAPQTLVRKNGAIAWAAAMDAFGQAHILPGAVVTNNLRFSSQYYDWESGLHYNTHRSLNIQMGYLSRDQIDEPPFAVLTREEISQNMILLGYLFFSRSTPTAQLLNQYIFAENNPIDKNDFLGLLTESGWRTWQRCVAPQVWGRRHNGNIPVSDGCSFPSWLGFVLPSGGTSDNPTGRCPFLDACQYHDYCYSDCAQTKASCDNGFKTRMYRACNISALGIADENERRRFLDSCIKWADRYAWGVDSRAGESAYKNRQQKNCDCVCPK